MDDHENSDECNLLYVAATRAKQYLVLNQSLVTSILAKAKDNFLYLQPKEMVNLFKLLSKSSIVLIKTIIVLKF